MVAKGMVWLAGAWMVLAVAARAQEPPPLPEGLDGAASAPAAPSGPPLPPGLDPGTPAAEAPAGPPLPPGLGAEPGAEPGLPPGLGGEPVTGAEDRGEDGRSPRDRLPLPVHGFWETRAGVRTQDDPAQSSDAILGEMRIQLETGKAWEDAVLDFTGDVYYDAVVDGAEFDLRRLRLTWTPHPDVDLRIGRQILTWGTGDMLFINDLFPKDWQSFFIGRDVEYLKAPSDSVRVGWYNPAINVEVAYTPQFTPDRYITGERISYYHPLLQRTVGEDHEVNANPPSTWFQDDEIALRLYRNIGSAEFALYGYSGYWKSPGGTRFRLALPVMQATFPKLSVYGASLRGKVWRGIGNVEVGYYDSRQDRGGDNPFVNNSEFRLLLGYEQELGRELTGAVQYYLEHIMDYRAYRNTLPFLIEPRDKDRHLFTVRLTKLLMNQNLTLSLFAYYSPSDGDAYLRPNASYKVTDRWTVTGGANVFLGESKASFFGQFEDNTNVYAGVRYAF